MAACPGKLLFIKRAWLLILDILKHNTVTNTLIHNHGYFTATDIKVMIVSNLIEQSLDDRPASCWKSVLVKFKG